MFVNMAIWRAHYQSAIINNSIRKQVDNPNGVSFLIID